MRSPELVGYVAGLLAMGHLVCGAFFLRFWRRTGDRLFLSFAVAFWLMAANQTILALLRIPEESREGVYLLRLAAFALIVWAIVTKNLRRQR